ncbi:MAG: low molecular weight protein tyrosine phosphatase family protein [Akkermansiaceae bacterium]
MQRLLFICSKNKWRSPTAEVIFADYPQLETDSAGLSKDAEVRLSAEQVEWADIIFVMEKIHRRKINEGFGKALRGKQIVVLDIPDRFPYMSPDLVDLLKRRCASYLR